MAGIASAGQFGDFTYTDDGTSITIIGYPTSATGVVSIPAAIVVQEDPLIELPVTAIGTNAFAFCTGLTSVTIPSGVTSIGVQAFYNCTGLASVTIPASVESIGTYAFYKCALTEMPLLPGLKTIGSNAFFQCGALASVTIPSTVTSLGAGAFYGCTSLTEVEIPSSVTSIPGGLFHSCSGLTRVTIPDSVTSIGATAFRYCSALTSLTIPPNVTSIGDKAFAYCTGLTGITIPRNVASIGTEVFSNCSALTAISVDEANPVFSSLNGVLFNEAQTTLLAYPPGLSGAYEIPAGVTSIGNKAFFTCGKLTGVTIPASVTAIGQQAFSTCGMLTSAVFSGDAPTMGSNVFELAAATFTAYYYAGQSGFDTEPWTSYTFPVVEIDVSNPITAWLVSKGLPTDANLNSDDNGDGVSLLLAYALDLDPNQNLSGSLPQPVFTETGMSLSFYAGSAGVTYSVQTCTNFEDWTTEGVTISEPDANQIRTATVDFAGPSRFMRLLVNH
jgi:hypothetical protein